MIKSVAVCLVLCICLSEAQRFRGGRRQGRRQGRQGGGRRRGREEAGSGYEAPEGFYSAPDDVPVYAGSDDVPVYVSEQAQAAYGAGDDALAWLANSVPGVPGEDYPIFSEVPESGFACDGQVDGGYYADPEAECQVFHICTADGQGGLSKYSFLCPNGTIFNQNYFICDWWFNFDCADAEGLYSINDDIAAERAEIDAAASDQAAYGSSSQDVYSAPPVYESAAPPVYEPAAPVYEAAPPADAYEARGARRLGGSRRNNRRQQSSRSGRRSGRRGGRGNRG